MTNTELNVDFLPSHGIRLAFFDLDETIIYKDSDLLWAQWRSKRNWKGLFDLFRLARINRLYYSHSLTASDYSAYHLKRAQSQSPEGYRMNASVFAEDVVSRYAYPDMLKLIGDNRSKGIRNVLITAQDEIIGTAFKELLHMDDSIASQYIIKNEKFTGMVQPLCFQEGKVHWAGDYLKSQNLKWEETAFYSDSLNDLPLLEACGKAVCVHPGKELSELAEKKNWPVFRPDQPVA